MTTGEDIQEAGLQGRIGSQRHGGWHSVSILLTAGKLLCKLELQYWALMRWRHFAQQFISPSLTLVAQDLSDLFRVEPEELAKSTTQEQLHNLHSKERAVSPSLAEHLAYLQEVPCYTGDYMTSIRCNTAV